MFEEFDDYEPLGQLVCFSDECQCALVEAMMYLEQQMSEVKFLPLHVCTQRTGLPHQQ